MTESASNDQASRDGESLRRDVEDASEPPAALLVHAARWWAEFADGVEQAVGEWNASRTAPARVTFTRQSPREISIAHSSASTELRLEGTRIRVVSRRAEPTRHNMGATTLVDFRADADGVVALASGQPSSPRGLVEQVVGSILRLAPAS
jgi:hypothetical protein